MSNVPTFSPETGLSSDISIADLGKLVGGEEILAPVIPAVEPKAAAPAAAEPKEPAAAPEAVAAEPPAAEPEKPTEAEGTTAEKTQEQEEEKKRWADKRLSQVSHKRREAEARERKALADLETERKSKEQLQRELEAFKTAQPGPTPPAAETPKSGENAKPALKDFVAALKDGEEYELAVERHAEALLDHRDRQRATERQKDADTQAQKEWNQQNEKDWKEGLEAHPDLEDVVERVRQGVPERLQVAVSQLRDDKNKALWPAITVYLDEHPDEVTALTTLFGRSQDAAIARLGRIAASLHAPSSGAPAPTPAAQTSPKRTAPKPPAVVGGTAAPGVIDLEKADMNTFAREVGKYL